MTHQYRHFPFSYFITQKYTVTPDGLSVAIHCRRPDSSNVDHIPRFAMMLRLQSGYENLKYFAKGPKSCYIDLQNHTHFGLFRSTVSDEYEPMIRPQECGNHIGAAFCTLSDGEHDITVSGSDFEFSALHFSP